MLESTTDQCLREQCLAHDDSAWRELYRRSFGMAFAIARASPFRFDAATAEDIAQDVVMELARRLLEVKNWIGFAGRVAHNKCVDRVRKRKEIPLAMLPCADDSDGAITQLRAPEFMPESIDDHRVFAALRAALSALGQPCRDLLYGRFFDELSYAQVAVHVSLPPEQVGVYIGRCLKRLRDRIEAQPGIWEELQATVESTGVGSGVGIQWNESSVFP